jgi:hypothetical protein
VWTPIRFLVERDGRRLEMSSPFRPATLELPPSPLFEHRQRSGRVDLARTGNVIEVRTRGVRQFTLLLSPGEFDFASPITVVVNGRTSFHGLVRKDPATLLRCAAQDNDRTMLFGAALQVRPD